ncbi:MAG TPA: N-acetyltransferase [Algoriphagus sp.]|nr:N-acetyltransferase [Algoriphagus sp.]
MDKKIKKSRTEYWPEILDLYRKVAQISGNLARSSEEISGEYVKNFLKKSHETGLSLIAFDSMNIIGEIHAYKLEPKVFSHVLSELTVAVHPDFQGMGLGRALFSAFLIEVKTSRPDILRVELISRESNKKAIHFYESLGFKQEGRLENRIDLGEGIFEADIPMAWINQEFGKAVKS